MTGMLGTLRKSRPGLPSEGGTALMEAIRCQPYVVSAFVCSSRMERDCIHLYAQTHPEVRAAAIVSGGRDLLALLRNGLRPEVLVLDALLTDMGILSLLEAIRTMHLEPEPVLLLTVPVPERTAARRAMEAFEGCEVILKPYSLKELFGQIYLLGAGAQTYRIYRIRNSCRRYLQEMQADPALSGCDYLERMLLYAVTAERSLAMAALYQLAARDCNTQENSVAAAVLRLSQKMQQHGTARYRQLCRRCGLPEEAVLPNGKLIKGLLELLRQEAI